jgi:hypothetical protein
MCMCMCMALLDCVEHLTSLPRERLLILVFLRMHVYCLFMFVCLVCLYAYVCVYGLPATADAGFPVHAFVLFVYVCVYLNVYLYVCMRMRMCMRMLCKPACVSGVFLHRYHARMHTWHRHTDTHTHVCV